MPDSRSEQSPDPSQEQLISLLQGDYSTQEPLTSTQGQEDNALMSLLGRAQPVEDVEARLSSDRNARLAQTVRDLLTSALVTDSFKDFIANEVRQAHAWRSTVGDAVSPERLGLTSGEGIFAASQAEGIEAQVLRGFVFDIVNSYTVAPQADASLGLPPLLLKPTVRPSDYAGAVDRLYDWAADFSRAYGHDPFEGLDDEIYLDAAPQAEVMSMEESESANVTELAKRLRQLRDIGQE